MISYQEREGKRHDHQFCQKRFILHVLVGLLIIALSGCGAVQEDETTSKLNDTFNSYSVFLKHHGRSLWAMIQVGPLQPTPKIMPPFLSGISGLIILTQ